MGDPKTTGYLVRVYDIGPTSRGGVPADYGDDSFVVKLVVQDGGGLVAEIAGGYESWTARARIAAALAEMLNDRAKV